MTGSSGQVGWWVRRLAPAGVDVAGIDLAGSPPMDIRDGAAREMVAAAGDGAVLHLAALIDVVASLEDPGPTLSTNVEGTRNLLAGLRPGARFVLVSSAAVYGDAPTPPIAEDGPVEPMSPYGASKLEAERLVAAQAERAGATWTVVRPFNIYSSRQDPRSPYTGVITKFIDLARRGEPLTIFGDGSQTRDFVHAADVADLLWRCANRPEAAGAVLNAGTGQATTVTRLAELVLELTDSRSDIVYAPARGGEVRHSVAHVGRARERLGWQPRVDLRAGLGEVLTGDATALLA